MIENSDSQSSNSTEKGKKNDPKFQLKNIQTFLKKDTMDRRIFLFAFLEYFLNTAQFTGFLSIRFSRKINRISGTAPGSACVSTSGVQTGSLLSRV